MRSGDAQIIMFLIIALFLVGFIVAYIFYLINLQNTIKQVSVKNRQLSPGEVWMVFIPVYNLIWQFFMVNRIADSLKAEFHDRGIPVNEDRPGAQLGVAYCTLNCCGIIPYLGSLASLGSIICMIIYWVKMSGYKNQLINAPRLNEVY